MKKLPSLKQLQHLVALYEYQHFGKAAEACYIGQSTLSASITNLEEILETQLLERDHKTFLFTPLGEEVVQRSRLIIANSEELADYARNQGLAMHGKLRLGCIPTIAPFILSELLADCRLAYPQVTLLIKEEITDNALRDLRQGKLDLVILALPYPTQEFHTRVLCQDNFRLVLPNGWLSKGFDKDMSLWPDNSLFLLEKEHCLTGHTLKVCQLEDAQKINAFSATSLPTLVQMVNHQWGVTYLPQIAINSGILSGTDLVSLPVTSHHAYREIGIAWRQTSNKQQSYHLLAELIQSILNTKCATSSPQ